MTTVADRWSGSRGARRARSGALRHVAAPSRAAFVNGAPNWVGAHGYRYGNHPFAQVNVWHRVYALQTSQWTTRDLHWPEERAYGYVNANPVMWVDPSGLWPLFKNCPENFVVGVIDICAGLYFISNQNHYLINQCILKASSRIGIECRSITKNRLDCLKRWCNSDGIVHCGKIGAGVFGMCPAYSGVDEDLSDPHDLLLIDHTLSPYGYIYATWFENPKDGPLVTWLHELTHACGQAHINTDMRRQCNDIQACCMYEVISKHNDGRKCVSAILPKPQPMPKPKS